MMINNNPYNLPQRSNQKNGRTYTEVSSAQYRKNDSLENNQSFRDSSVRNQNSNGIPSNLMMKKSGINQDEIVPSFRPPMYPNMKPDIKHYLPSPKNTSSNSSNFSTMSNQRGSFNMGSQSDQKETQNNNQQHTSVGISNFDLKDIQEKIETMAIVIKHNEKRISELEKGGTNSGFLPNNSGMKTDDSNNNLDAFSSMITKLQLDWNEQLRKIKDDIFLVRQEIKHQPSSKQLQANRYQESLSNSLNLKNMESSVSGDLRKETEILRKQLSQKMQKNHDFLTSVMGRMEREMLNTSLQINPSYKASAIKCSGSATLLRFVECFKVRKNAPGLNNKGGQIKILLTDNTYYIDSEGFLLDKQQHYLVDQRGNQVRLDEKHIKMLRQQKVLM